MYVADYAVLFLLLSLFTSFCFGLKLVVKSWVHLKRVQLVNPDEKSITNK